MPDHVTYAATAKYLADLKAKLDARTKPGSEKSMAGYQLNVQALRKEIARVEMRLATQKAAYERQVEERREIGRRQAGDVNN